MPDLTDTERAMLKRRLNRWDRFLSGYIRRAMDDGDLTTRGNEQSVQLPVLLCVVEDMYAAFEHGKIPRRKR